MSRALYRTYRSRSFDEVIGQSHVTDLLKNAIKGGKVAHAYLLTGPRGVGKTSVARIIAHEVNGLEYSEDPHLDIIEIDAASNRRIDDIRDLREKVHIAPVGAKYKVYIIDEVHMLTGESFNALLKTLEEPPEHAIFILATTEVHKVPATIISRTQRFHFRPATVSDISKHLAAIAKKEKIDHDPAALALIALHAGGSFRDSVSLLDQLSGLSEKITTELVESVFGMANRQHIDAIIGALESQDTDTIIGEIEAITKEGISAHVLVDQLGKAIHERAKTNHSLYLLLDELIDVPKAHDPQLKLIATLVKFAKPPVRKVAATRAPAIPTVSATPKDLRAAKKQAEEKPAAQPEAAVIVESVEPSPAPIAPIGNGTFDWEQILTTIKKHHAPLYSVLSRAEMGYDDANTRLNLHFNYVIHRKKLENPASRKQLLSVIHDLFGLVPELNITDAKTTTQALDGAAEAVAAIMGGGEPVRGAI